jgi:hypothetical protein
MKYPQILLLPLLMFADYFLTVWGAVLKDGRYGNHFKSEHYELNPVWQKAISRKRWVNPRHILLTLFTSGILAVALEFCDLPDSLPDYLFGCLFVLFGMVVGVHVSNILMFRRVARFPEEISGQVVMAHALLLRTSAFRYLVAAIPIAIIAIFSPTPFTIGAAAGAVSIFAVHSVWIWRYKRASNPKGGANMKQPDQAE